MRPFPARPLSLPAVGGWPRRAPAGKGLYPAGMATLGLLAILGCGPDQSSPTAPQDRAEPAASATAAALSFYQLSAGWMRTCGVTTDNRAYCWGDNAEGYLGDGTTTDRLSPTAVVGGLHFRQITTGAAFTCGVTTDFRAYCWGFGGRGDLGNGGTAEHDSPVAVTGGHQFRHVDAGFDHACGLTYPDNRVYCWGQNADGQLGIGTRTGPESCPFSPACSLKPVPIASTLTFRQVASGWFHSCAITTDDRLFCWGLNSSGQVGDSTSVFRRTRPSRVGRSHHWKQVDGGNDFTCAVTTTEQAFCWGNGRDGQIGNGHTYLSFWPRLVAGKHAFRRVTAGGKHACGETPSSVGWCWGLGALGVATTTQSLVPVAVSGGLFFSQLSAGYGTTCGRTPAAVGYCWGSNTNGELGLGQADFTPHLLPTPIGPPS
jgi:alpha-tubulin suppressor-like RCC1 family protein